MRWGTSIVDQHESYPHGQQVVRVDDTDTYQLQAAARELQAHLRHEQVRHLAEVRILLVERFQRDGVAVEAAALDAQAEQVAAEQRGERFLAELASHRLDNTPVHRATDLHQDDAWAAGVLYLLC
jgi:hypothetical protein